MILRILKKDLKRKKAMNLILFVFIILCTTFSAGSLNNLLTTTKALDYFASRVNASDYFMVCLQDPAVSEWVQKSPAVTQAEQMPCMIAKPSNITLASGAFAGLGTPLISTLPQKMNLILDEKDQVIGTLKSGEIVVPSVIARKGGLSIGDKITVTFGEHKKELVITHIAKDMVFGSEYMGSKRLLISEEDFEFFSASGEAALSSFYSIKTDNKAELTRDLNKQSFAIVSGFDQEMMRATYMMDMVAASILIVVSLCLILIAFVILRFTIVFTLQEDYREIGIMKAIGIKNARIKGIYIVKYLGMAVAGTAVGIAASIPFGNLMLENIRQNIAMESSTGNIAINLISGGIIILLVATFCYLSTGKVNRWTAVQAIRSGSAGERFGRGFHFRLHKHRKLPVILCMAVNDIFSNVKSYGVLVITFALGTLLVILPVNAANTLKSADVVSYFALTKSDVFIENHPIDAYFGKGDVNLLLNDLKALEKRYQENRVDVSLHVEYQVQAKCYVSDPDDSVIIAGLHSKNVDAEKYVFTRGTAPKLKNEIAMTEVSMKNLGLGIGDTVQISLGETVKPYLITASYQTMDMMGQGFRFAAEEDVDFHYVSAILSIQGDFADRTDVEGQIEKMRKATPEYSLKNINEFAINASGGSAAMVDSMKNLILAVVLFINCLITVLLTKTFSVRDVGEIALLKNIGFSNGAIQWWQSLRLLLVGTVSIFLGVLLSAPLTGVMNRFTFGLMGAADIPTSVVPQEVYLFYPICLVLGTGLAAALSTAAVRKVNLREVNNME